MKEDMHSRHAPRSLAWIRLGVPVDLLQIAVLAGKDGKNLEYWRIRVCNTRKSPENGAGAWVHLDKSDTLHCV